MYSKRVNIVTEPTIKLKDTSKLAVVLAYTYLSPGSNRVKVMLKNTTASSLTVEKGRQVLLNTGLEFAPGVNQLKGETRVKLDEPTHPDEAVPVVDRTPLGEEQFQELFAKLNLAENI